MKKIITLLMIITLTSCRTYVSNPLIVQSIRKLDDFSYKYAVVIKADIGDIEFHTDSIYKVGDTLK
jgi:hypothetical protein